MTYFRLSRKPNELPTHWAYGEPWELDVDEVIDNRVRGVQVWANLRNVIVAAAGSHSDGDYDYTEYPYFLVLESDDCRDGSGEWYSVNRISSVRCCDSAALVHWCVEQSNCDLVLGRVGNQQEEFDTLGDWVSQNEGAVATWIQSHSRPVAVKRVDTLPCPESYTRIS